MTGSVYVMTINVFGMGQTSTETCCLFKVLPDPAVASGEIEFVDCGDNVVFATNEGYAGNVGDGEANPVVSNRGPSDGATNQRLDTKLAWTLERCSFEPVVAWNDIFFGTSPDPPLVYPFYEGCCEFDYDPGPLQPGTTYYWKIRGVDGGAGATETPVWSFTTKQAVAAQPSTWGRVKALYGQ